MHNRRPAWLRYRWCSESSWNAFGIIPDSAFGFAGVPSRKDWVLICGCELASPHPNRVERQNGFPGTFFGNSPGQNFVQLVLSVLWNPTTHKTQNKMEEKAGGAVYVSWGRPKRGKEDLDSAEEATRQLKRPSLLSATARRAISGGLTRPKWARSWIYRQGAVGTLLWVRQFQIGCVSAGRVNHKRRQASGSNTEMVPN